MQYIQNALFIFDLEGEKHLSLLEKNPYGTQITFSNIVDFLDDPEQNLNAVEDVVVCVEDQLLEPLLQAAKRYGFSLAFIPQSGQKLLAKTYDLPLKPELAMEIALRDDAKKIDLIECNGHIMQFKATLGTIPLLSTFHQNSTFNALFFNLTSAVKQFFQIDMQQFEVETANGKNIKTAASGSFVLQSRQSILDRVLHQDISMRDGQVSLVLISPYSVVKYLQLLISLLFFNFRSKSMSEMIGVVRSKKILIKSSISKALLLDDTISVALPAQFSVERDAIRLHAGEKFWEENPAVLKDKETIRMDNLPDEREMSKYLHKRIPLFSYASEDRFKELFMSLREDAELNKHYVMLMVLSTLLATIGLLSNSSAVVIGAMLRAPLMAPIVSLSMGILRGDERMLKASLLKIVVGIMLALVASASVVLLLPNMEMTSEMLARINPTILDMAVAIFSGVAAAYSKSFKKIAQNLAGVAIAVALVPPLSVAGIGLGYGDLYVFGGAFLLFFTNLVGISLAATITFLLLGFSSVVKSTKSMIIVSILMVAVTFPLFISYQRIIDTYELRTEFKQNRYLVNDKYVIIKYASIIEHENGTIVDLLILVHAHLNRDDLVLFKQKLEDQFHMKLFIRVREELIL